MKYAWEKGLSVDDAGRVVGLRAGFFVIGVLVENGRTGEGAVVFADIPKADGVQEMDVLEDCQGDLQAAYDAADARAMKSFERARERGRLLERERAIKEASEK
jgi:hypothetical protein